MNAVIEVSQGRISAEDPDATQRPAEDNHLCKYLPASHSTPEPSGTEDCCLDESVSMSKEFLVGVAMSVYQNSGGVDNNWEAFESMKNWFGQPYIKGGQRCGHSSDFWNNYESDIARAAKLNSNCFRLSLEWSRIEPRKGQIDQENVSRYTAIFESLQRHNLKPVVTLYHFVHPLWFDELGAFEKEENISYFVNFAQTAFQLFGKYVHMWATFNEINVQAFCGYLYGIFPPAKMLSHALAGRLFLNMLRAHTAAYQAIKALPGGQVALVGIVHNYLKYEPQYPDGPSSYYIKPLCKLMASIWGNGLMVRYLREGVFEWPSLLGNGLQFKEPQKPGCDFIGINYYGRVILDWKFSTTCRTGEKMTDMPFPLCASGLYVALKDMSAVGVPLYITETGVADERDVLRKEMMTTYFHQVKRAAEDDIDIRGLMYWTLIDNFEWAEGFGIRFGLYRWNPGEGHIRKEVPSTPFLAKIFDSFPQTIKEVWSKQALAK